MRNLGPIFFSCVVALCGCHGGPLQSANDVLSMSAELIDFGPAYSGRQAIDRVVLVHNKGRAIASVTYAMPNAPFELLTAPSTLNTGDTVLRLRFRPVSTTAFGDQLEVTSDTQLLSLRLVGTGTDLTECGQPATCHELQFDVNQNVCIDSVLADGTACDPHDNCSINATCSQGRCIGVAVSCDDQNPCTVDTCNAVLGCQHLNQNTCPSSDACHVGVCNPTSGCSVVAVSDGTPCGKQQTCDAAQVCVSGVCELKDPPDGYICAQATPCQGQGVCQGSLCVQPTATTLVENWRFDSLETQDAGELDDAGMPPPWFNPVVLQDFAMDEASGEISLMGFESIPWLRANTAQSFESDAGPGRRCMTWNDRLVCADYPGGINGQVTVVDRVTGDRIWDFALGSARPDFAALCSNLFMGRLAVLGGDRLAALFEGYVANNDDTTANCRLYFLTVLDASGALISSAQLTDPEVSTCNHPHPYGFSSDTAGNLYAGFAPTQVPGGPPLHPDVSTTVMSFTRDGNFRWKFTDVSLVGGEIAVSNGVLYPENSTQAISTTSGQPVAQLSEPFGRAVLTTDRLILAPWDMAGAVNGYMPGTSTSLWSHALPTGTTFWGDQVRLATWSTGYGDVTVALNFTTDGTTPSLHAMYVDDGSDAFSCPIQMNARGSPQLFEVGAGKMSLMEGAVCEKCDPPFAGSSGAFHSFDVPFLAPANAPWTGTFGGAGHDGQENTVVVPMMPGN